MKPRCLFIGSTKYNYKAGKPSPVKYSLLSLMSHVADIADIEILDFEMLFGYPNTLEEIQKFRKYVNGVLKERHPDIVAVSCYTSYDYLASIDILKICRELYPKATLVVGGYHPTAVPEDFVGKQMYVDYVIKGEGENALRNIILCNGKNMPQIITGEILDLNEEKPLRYDLYPYKSDELSISLSRGCFYKCAFCVQSDDYLIKYRKIEFEKIKDKINRAAEYFPLKRLMFTDPIFGTNLDETKELVDFLKKNYPQYSYWAETRIDRLTEELVATLSELNIDLFFGVESLAEDTLMNLMNKTPNAQNYNDSFFRAVELCQRYNMLGMFNFIMNYPCEQFESSHYTLSQIEKVWEKYDKLCVSFHINQYVLYPGNKIYDMRYKLNTDRGFLFPNDGWWRSYEPDIIKRGENCIASTSINNKYNGNNHYWQREKNILLRRFVSKYDFRAYQFFQKDEIQSIIHVNEKEVVGNIYNKVFQIVARYRYFLTSQLSLYHMVIDSDKSEEFINTFDKIYLYATYEADNQLINACFEEKGEEILDYICKDLSSEYERNIAALSLTSNTYMVVLGNKKFNINSNGKLVQKGK